MGARGLVHGHQDFLRLDRQAGVVAVVRDVATRPAGQAIQFSAKHVVQGLRRRRRLHDSLAAAHDTDGKVQRQKIARPHEDTVGPSHCLKVPVVLGVRRDVALERHANAAGKRDQTAGELFGGPAALVAIAPTLHVGDDPFGIEIAQHVLHVVQHVGAVVHQPARF